MDTDPTGNRYSKTWRLGYPKWYKIDRVRPEDGELLGSLHAEKKRCGKENCRCTSGREEDLHGPYYYRRWRDSEGNQHKEYVPKPEVDTVRTRIQKRRRRLKRGAKRAGKMDEAGRRERLLPGPLETQKPGRPSGQPRTARGYLGRGVVAASGTRQSDSAPPAPKRS